jgi:hypothetical protein
MKGHMEEIDVFQRRIPSEKIQEENTRRVERQSNIVHPLR